MSAKLVNLLIGQINELDPDIDTSVGSNFRDLLINPLATLLSNYESEHQRILNNLSLADPSLFTDNELDAIAANFLVERNEGAYHTGEVRMYFEEATPLTIPKNTRFRHQASGNEYETVSATEVTRSSMEESLDISGLYSTPPLKVRSVDRRSSGALNTGVFLTAVTFRSPAPQRVEVSSDITGGSQRESNEALYARLIDSVKTSTMASESVLKNSIKSFSPQVKDVEIIGAGNPLMVRDLIAYDPLVENVVEDFKLVVPGQSDPAFYKGHQAFLGVFGVDEITGGGVSSVPLLPENFSEWNKEFSLSQYRGIYKIDDATSATQNEHALIEINSWNQAALSDFLLNDGAKRNNSLVNDDEIRIVGNDLVLGLTPTPQDQVEVRMTLEEVEQIARDLEDTSTAPTSEETLQLINSLKGQVENKIDPQVYANMAPIIHKSLEKNTGIRIDTTMSTTDGTDFGEISYLTVLRNDQIFMAHDGYGLAWRKQPDFLIRLNYDDYEDDDLRAADIELFEELFGVNPEDEGLVGNEELSNPDNDQYWLFNVYLVDNNVLSEEVQMGTNRVFDSINGINQYLQRSKYWIEPNKSYDFRLQISDTLATKAWIRPSSGGDYALKIDKGVTFPEYVPAAGQKITSENSSVEELNAEIGHFGIAVGQTKGYEWFVDSLSITRMEELFPSHLFKFYVDTDKWDSINAPFEVNYLGSGFDPDGDAEVYLAIWNANEQSWEHLGSHNEAPEDPLDAQLLKIQFEGTGLENYLDASNNLWLCSIPTNFNDLNHRLRSYYVSLSNPNAGKKALGNAIDVYVHDPDNVSTRSTNLVVTNGDIILEDGHIQDIVEIREALSQIEIDPLEYRVHNMRYGESFGEDNKIKISFNEDENEGIEVTVIYRKWIGGDQINAYLNDPDNRYPAVSLKEKIMPPAVVTITGLEITGELSSEDANNTIVNYINNLDSLTLNKSGIINQLVDAGAESVNTDFDITIKQYYTNFTHRIIPLTGDSYTIPTNTRSRFFTTEDNIDV